MGGGAAGMSRAGCFFVPFWLFGEQQVTVLRGGDCGGGTVASAAAAGWCRRQPVSGARAGYKSKWPYWCDSYTWGGVWSKCVACPRRAPYLGVAFEASASPRAPAPAPAPPQPPRPQLPPPSPPPPPALPEVVAAGSPVAPASFPSSSAPPPPPRGAAAQLPPFTTVNHPGDDGDHLSPLRVHACAPPLSA